MDHVFLDFEMNPISRSHKEARQVVRGEIIEIGAVKLDSDYLLTDRYSAYVKPALCGIAPHIVTLTGITDQKVAGASPLSEALEAFVRWIGPDSVRIYSWSDSDKKQLTRECQLKELPLPRVFRRWMDFQRIYTRLLGLSRRSRLSLSNAVGSVENDFEGKQHSAMADAENAASLLTLVKDREAFARRSKIIRELMDGDSVAATTLGDLYGDLFAQYITSRREAAPEEAATV